MSIEPHPDLSARGSFLAEVRARIDARLEEVLQAAQADAERAGPEPAAVVAALAALVRRGGKRLRPALLTAAYLAGGGPLTTQGHWPRAVTDAGAAFELLQAYFLVHDDWMDGDRERRGGPAVHAALEARHASPHLGASLAVLAGDYASGLAHAVLAEIDASPAVVVEATRLFCRMEQEVVLGQTLDLTLGDLRGTRLETGADAAAVDRMHALKTGSYTVHGPLAIGAALALAPAPVRAALGAFGAPLGVAFQLRDDLLGTFGDPSDTGKPVGSDLRTGKRTALVASAFARASAKDRARLTQVLGQGDALDPRDLAFAVELLERCGARADLEARIAALHDEAVAALAPLGADAALLVGLAGAIARRSK
ncbi:MAG: polyprenyl synthetase family protein [Myxococcales bacterium]|nr:polyprenyl synthetase family protein [Myxococcales bacterium]